MGKKFFKNLFLIFLSAFAAASLFANAGIFGGKGENLTISETDKIQMVSEVVKITPMPNDSLIDMGGKNLLWARYECKFILKNLSDEKITTQAGFPLSGIGGKLDIEQLSKNRKFKASAVSQNSQDIKNYNLRFSSRDKDKKFKAVFVWDMEFQPNETLELNVSYELSGYMGMGITQKIAQKNAYHKISYLCELSNCLAQSFPYVTKTGESWAMEIESAVFIFNVGEFEKYLDEKFPFDMGNSKKKKYKLFAELLKNGQRVRHVNPNCTEKDGVLTAKFSPFKPQDDFFINYYFTMIPKNGQSLDMLLQLIEETYEESRAIRNSYAERENKPLNEKAFSDKDRKNIADIVLEFYGIKTDNPEISDFLEDQCWYPVEVAPKIDEKLKKKLLKLSRQ